MVEHPLMIQAIDYQILFENSNDGILIHDLEKDIIISANPRCLELLDRAEEDILFKNPSVLLPSIQPDGKLAAEILAENIRISKLHGKRKTERIHYRKDGSALWFSISTYLMPAPNKHLLVVVYQEITRIKKQQEVIENQYQDLVKKNVELKKYIESNTNLENFAYMAAHDLQAPIRTMLNFSKMLKKSIAKEDLKNAGDFSEYIVNASKDMHALISDLLNYSRINTIKLSPKEISIKGLLAGILWGLDSEIKERQVNIKMHNLPETIFCDKVKIRQLFQNLISNGIKFNTSERQRIIEVNCHDKKDVWEFEVKDNGIGIEPKYFTEIFKLFTRVNAKKQFNGTGIGLALCKKIVEQHQGKIWLKSELSAGTSFFFTIPKIKS